MMKRPDIFSGFVKKVKLFKQLPATRMAGEY